MLYRAVLVIAATLAASASAFTLAPVAAPLATTAAAVHRVEVIDMGRGDKRTAKGKRKAKSHGNSRPKNSELRKRAAANAAEQ